MLDNCWLNARLCKLYIFWLQSIFCISLNITGLCSAAKVTYWTSPGPGWGLFDVRFRWVQSIPKCRGGFGHCSAPSTKPTSPRLTLQELLPCSTSVSGCAWAGGCCAFLGVLVLALAACSPVSTRGLSLESILWATPECVCCSHTHTLSPSLSRTLPPKGQLHWHLQTLSSVSSV